jgi:hypothetical protein
VPNGIFAAEKMSVEGTQLTLAASMEDVFKGEHGCAGIEALQVRDDITADSIAELEVQVAEL